MNASVSVILSTYNSPNYLRRVLDEYLKQSRLPDELIVADDGSTEETADLVAAVAFRAPFPIRHIWHEDLGFRLAKIRNEAVMAASSDYLIFSDGDCVPHRSFVGDHVALMERGFFVTGKRILLGPAISPDFKIKSSLKMFYLGIQGKLSGVHHLPRIPRVFWTSRTVCGLKGCNIAVFRKDVISVNGYDESFIGWGREDSDFAARLMKYGLIRKIPPFAAIIYHLWHPENSRSELGRNDELLRSALSRDDFVCRNGLVKATGAAASVGRPLCGSTSQ